MQHPPKKNSRLHDPRHTLPGLRDEWPELLQEEDSSLSGRERSVPVEVPYSFDPALTDPLTKEEVEVAWVRRICCACYPVEPLSATYTIIDAATADQYSVFAAAASYCACRFYPPSRRQTNTLASRRLGSLGRREEAKEGGGGGGTEDPVRGMAL